MNRSNRSRIGSVGLLAATLCLIARASFGGAVRREASLDPVVSIEPPVAYIQAGELCTLGVAVGGTDSLGCMEVLVAFDTAFALCTGVIEGSSFRDAGCPTFFLWEMPASDTASAVDCLLGYRTYFLAPGELVKFVFQGRGPGVCPVSIASVRLYDINRVELSPVVGCGSEIIIQYATGGDPVSPGKCSLWNYPNPFNPSTVITFSMPGTASGSNVDLAVYSVAGRRIRSLHSGRLAGERGVFVWDGKDDRGRGVAAGLYIAVARTGDVALRRKMILIK